MARVIEAYAVRGNSGLILVHDTSCDPEYFWVRDACDMTVEKVAAALQSGSLTPCPLGLRLVVSSPSPVRAERRRH